VRLPFFSSSSRIWSKAYPFAKSLLKQRFHTEQHTGGSQSTGDPAWPGFLVPPLFRGEMSAFSGDGALHQENQKGEYHGSYRKNQERIEIGKSRGLLFAKIFKRL
jgi:hypothetical protein